MEEIETYLVRDAKAIFEHIMLSKEKGSSIGICSVHLGEGVFITAVEDLILQDGEQFVIVKPMDLTGYILKTTLIRLSDIKAVYPLISPYQNPLLKRFARLKD